MDPSEISTPEINLTNINNYIDPSIDIISALQANSLIDNPLDQSTSDQDLVNIPINKQSFSRDEKEITGESLQKILDETEKRQIPIETEAKSNQITFSSEKTVTNKTDNSQDKTINVPVNQSTQKENLSVVENLIKSGISLIGKLNDNTNIFPAATKEDENTRLIESSEAIKSRPPVPINPPKYQLSPIGFAPHDQSTFRFYCISQKSNQAQRNLIRKRFDYHGLLPWLTFVDAITPMSPLLQHYTIGTTTQKDPAINQKLRTSAKLASHLKALRTYLEEPNSILSRGAIICEDHVLLRNDWSSRYKSIMENLPAKANLVQLSYILDSWQSKTQWSGKDEKKENLFKILLPETGDLATRYTSAAWGTQMYWISLSQAMTSIRLYDRPFRQLENFGMVTSELITIIPCDYLSYPILALDDCLPLPMETPEELEYRIKRFAPWGYSNYNGGDDDGKMEPSSPLFQIEKGMCGQRPSPPPKKKNIQNPVG